MPQHAPETLLANVLAEIKSANALIDQRDSATRSRLAALEGAVNDIMKRTGRPHGGNGFDPDIDERKSAIGLLEQKHFAAVTKADPALGPPNFTSEQIAEAQLAIRGLRSLMHSTSIDQVPLDQRKALSAFSFGSSGFILAPEMSNQILSCLVDVTDIAGLMNNVNVSGAGIKFFVDNELWDVAAWACESSCFANNPTKQIGDGLGELEIKPESLRYIVCSTRELLEDSSVNIEMWLLDKARRAFAYQINDAILTGDGFGKPMGILNPQAGIPIAETADGTSPGQFAWQDLIMLRWQVPQSLQGDGAYLMNQHTWALCSTMSDANGRPIMVPGPTQAVPFLLGGVPVVIANQMPDVAPGSTPVAYGNWKQAYTVVNRKAVTMTQDPYSAGFCVLFKFGARRRDRDVPVRRQAFANSIIGPGPARPPRAARKVKGPLPLVMAGGPFLFRSRRFPRGSIFRHWPHVLEEALKPAPAIFSEAPSITNLDAAPAFIRIFGVHRIVATREHILRSANVGMRPSRSMSWPFHIQRLHHRFRRFSGKLGKVLVLEPASK